MLIALSIGGIEGGGLNDKTDVRGVQLLGIGNDFPRKAVKCAQRIGQQ